MRSSSSRLPLACLRRLLQHDTPAAVTAVASGGSTWSGSSSNAASLATAALPPHAAAAAAAAAGLPLRASRHVFSSSACARSAAPQQHEQEGSQLQDVVEEAATAAESAAVVQHEALELLQRVGLRASAAEALHKAWASAELRMLAAPGSSLLFPTGKGSRRVSQLSTARLLVVVKRLLRAHAAAAADEAAAAAAAADGTREGSAAHTPGWGCLDLQAVLIHSPDLVLLPPAVLASRLGALLAAIHPLLGTEPSRAFIHNSPAPRLMLDDPAATAAKLYAMRDAYVGVMGAPPRPLLLSSSQSSYSRGTVGKFTEKLRYFESKWGADVAHVMLNRQPHLLSSSSLRLDTNTSQVQQLLGCSDEKMARLVKLAPRLVSSDFRSTRDRLLGLTTQLSSVGLEAEDVRRLVLKMPLLMLLDPVNTATKLAHLKTLLGPASHRLRLFVLQEPTLLSNNSGTLTARVQGLQEILGLGRDRVCRTIAKAPALLSLDSQNLMRKLQELTTVFSIDPPAVQRLCALEPLLLIMRPETIAAKILEWGNALHKEDLSDVIAALRANPRVLSFDSANVIAHMHMLEKLVARSSKWLEGHAISGVSASTTPVGGADTPATAPPAPPAVPSAAAAAAAAAAGTPAAPLNYHERLAGIKAELRAQHPEWAQPELTAAARERYREVRQLQRQLQEQSKQAHGRQRSSGNIWQLRYSRSISGRMLLRLEFLIATGQHEQVSLAKAFSITTPAWAAQYPDYASWTQMRLQHLRAHPSDWPPALVERLAAMASPARAQAAAYAATGNSRIAAARARAREAAAAAADAPAPKKKKAKGGNRPSTEQGQQTH